MVFVGCVGVIFAFAKRKQHGGTRLMAATAAAATAAAAATTTTRRNRSWFLSRLRYLFLFARMRDK